MNIIFARHDDDARQFAFEVSRDQVPYIKKGDILLVDTMLGQTKATATTGVISGEGAVDISLKNGAYLPLKKVITFVPSLLMDAILSNAVIISKGRLAEPEQQAVLPF